MVFRIKNDFYFLSLPFSFTVSPESIVIPIVSCIFGFPLLALLVICCLRRRAKLARERDRRRNYDLQDHAVSLVRFSPIHRLSESQQHLIGTFFLLSFHSFNYSVYIFRFLLLRFVIQYSLVYYCIAFRVIITKI